MDKRDVSDLADLSELSREQILERLAPRIAKARGDTSFDGKCKFLPSKGPQIACPLPAATAWGFCSKHSRTAQGRGAQLSWKESAKAEIPDEESEEEAPTPKSSRRVLRISRNKYGRYCDPDTGLCFDGITKAVIGYQEPSGEFRTRLTPKEKKFCAENGLAVQESKSKGYTEDTSFVRRPIQKKEPEYEPHSRKLPPSDYDAIARERIRASDDATRRRADSRSDDAITRERIRASDDDVPKRGVRFPPTKETRPVVRSGGSLGRGGAASGAGRGYEEEEEYSRGDYPSRRPAALARGVGGAPLRDADRRSAAAGYRGGSGSRGRGLLPAARREEEDEDEDFDEE